MPPIRRSARKAGKPKGFWAGSTSNRKPAKRNAKKAPRNFNRRGQTFASKSSQMVRLRTLQPPELLVSAQYRQTIYFSDMGYAGGGTPCLLRIRLDNPTGAGGVPGSRFNVVDVVSFGGAHVAPAFTRSNSDRGVTDLDQYFDAYRKACVTSSNAKVRICGVINQKQLGQNFVNVSAQGAQGDSYPYDENHMPYLSIAEASRDGELSVWGVKQKTVNLLHQQGPGNDETPTLNEMKTKIPGVRMKQLRCFKDGHASTPVMLNASHTPASTWGLQKGGGWRDNIKQIQVYPSTTVSSGFADDKKDSLFYVGVCNNFPSTVGMRPALVRAEVVVNYRVRFIDRINAYGENDPLPIPEAHTEL